MAESSVVHIGENSPEEVAYKLMKDIYAAEDKYNKGRSRDEILNLYAECLLAVRSPQTR